MKVSPTSIYPMRRKRRLGSHGSVPSRAALHLDTYQLGQNGGSVWRKIRKDRALWSKDSAIKAGKLVHLPHVEGTQSYHSQRLPIAHNYQQDLVAESSKVRGMEWEGPMAPLTCHFDTAAEASTSVRPSSKSQGHWWSQFELWSFWNPAALVEHLTRTEQPSQGWKRFKAALSQEHPVTENAHTPKTISPA